MENKTVATSRNGVEMNENVVGAIPYTKEELEAYPLLNQVQVGMTVIGLPGSDYEGLEGVVTDIYYGENRETENDTIVDIEVDFKNVCELEETHPHLNGTGIEGVMMGEDELAFLIGDSYMTGKGESEFEHFLFVQFVSVWDKGFEVETNARYNPTTRIVYDIQSAEAIDDEGDELEVLDSEFIRLPEEVELTVEEHGSDYMAKRHV